MSTWVTHLIIADKVLKCVPGLCRHEFCVGNIAPDCNIENDDWTSFTPPREVTHWMTGNRKAAADCDRFLREYLLKKDVTSPQEESFLLGYYTHLIVDAEFQRYIRDEVRVKRVWDRIQEHPELKSMTSGMPQNWDSVKALIPKPERMKDIYSMEKDYLDRNPDSGYLTDILGLTAFPDYLTYLPQGAIVRKIKVMGYLPQKAEGKYSYIAMSKEEYSLFLDTAAKMAAKAIGLYQTIHS